MNFKYVNGCPMGTARKNPYNKYCIKGKNYSLLTVVAS